MKARQDRERGAALLQDVVGVDGDGCCCDEGEGGVIESGAAQFALE